ncbi:phage portal protein [Pseudoclavibacter alba]|uniref:phage portal protein n=1 Tax=Pseudoclavibacter albus TaxID=272241 RepID=UPI0019D30CEF|nr:phage portal protein [Pseudoclavibacter alba]MBN6777426.1 phage portal protein [Pseudoclavibacter alba]
MSFDTLVKQTPAWSDYRAFEAYYEGKRRLQALGVNLPPQVRVLEMVVDWPRIVVEAMSERLHVDGFTVAGAEQAPDEFLRWWRANRMQSVSSLVHTEALVQGLAYIIVGEELVDGVPQWNAVTRDRVRCRLDDVTGEPVEAARFFNLDGEQLAAHYEPHLTTFYGKTRDGRWVVSEKRETPFSRPPVVPVVNRSRLRGRGGRSEMVDVMGYTDACSRSLTNLQIGQELLALPQRYMLGGQKGGFRDAAGNELTSWEVYIGHLMTGPENAKVGQLPGADLSQIHATVRLYAGFVAGSSGVPLSSLGIGTEANPASADAVIAYSNRHVKKAELKQVAFGDAYEQVMRLGAELVGDPDLVSAAASLETTWRNAATITTMETAQAAVMLVQNRIIPPAIARDMIGLTAEQKRVAAEWDRSDPLGNVSVFNASESA